MFLVMFISLLNYFMVGLFQLYFIMKLFNYILNFYYLLNYFNFLQGSGNVQWFNFLDLWFLFLFYKNVIIYYTDDNNFLNGSFRLLLDLLGGNHLRRLNNDSLLNMLLPKL